MNGYEAVAKILKKEGFEWLACFPSNPIIEAVANEGIRPIVFRQERGGIMAADGYSRLMASKGKYGVFACQGGPGVENAFGGFAQAWADSVPVLFLPDGPGTYKSGVAPTFSGTRNFQNITKFAASVTTADSIAPLMRRATEALKNGRPGPVMVEIHRDGMVADVPEGAVENYQPTSKHLFAPSASDIKDAADKLLGARMPAIWAGQGVLHAGATAELLELAELTQIPVMTTMPGKSAIDERHPLALGAANRTAPKPVWTWLRESDVLFAVGASLTVTNYGIDLPPGKFLIHCTNNPADISKEYTTDIGLVGDAGDECVAIGGAPAGGGGDAARPGDPVAAHLAGADAQRGDGPRHGRLGQRAPVADALAEPNDARERVDDAECPAFGARHQQSAVVGAEVDGGVGVSPTPARGGAVNATLLL